MKSNYGITGDIASGKSTLSRYLKKLGFTIIDADQIARDVVEPGEEGHRRVKEVFPEVFQGEILDRGKLGKLIYQDPMKKQKLEEILHPLIIETMLQQAEGITAFFDAPLLFEAGLDKYCKKILYVGLDPDIQRQRLMERDEITEQEANKTMEAFVYPREEKIRNSIYLDNSSRREELYRQIESFLLEEGLLEELHE